MIKLSLLERSSMRFILASVLLSLVAVPVLAQEGKNAAASEGSGVITTLSPKAAEQILKGMGFEVEQPKEGVFVFPLAGYKALLFLSKNRTSLQLYAGFKKKASVAKVNEWNKSKRFSRAYIDDEGDPVIESDLDLEGGSTVGAIQEFIRTFRLSVDAYVSFLSE